MERRNALWLSLVFAMTFACAPMLAQAVPQGSLPPLPKPGAQPIFPFPRPGDVEAAANARQTISGPYRLTYTLTEMDGTKRVGSQHYQLVQDADAQWTSLNLGTRIPIETGASGTSALSPLTQISYIDVGIHIKCELRQFANGLELNSQVEQSAVEAQQSQSITPVIRHTNLNDTVLLHEDKPVILGNADIPGSTRSLQIEVELTRVH